MAPGSTAGVHSSCSQLYLRQFEFPGRLVSEAFSVPLSTSGWHLGSLELSTVEQQHSLAGDKGRSLSQCSASAWASCCVSGIFIPWWFSLSGRLSRNNNTLSHISFSSSKLGFLGNSVRSPSLPIPVSIQHSRMWLHNASHINFSGAVY